MVEMCRSISLGLTAKATFGDVEFVGASSSETPPKHRVIFVLGGPGAGKGTQCANIVAHYPYVTHLSVGELLRNAKANHSPHADQIEECLVAGQIVPVAISLALLRDAMDHSGASLFLVDGFPRNFDNLTGWLADMPTARTAVLGALVFDCPVEELERRILERGKTSGRSDDNAQSIRKRFATFDQQTAPVVRVLEGLPDNDDESSSSCCRVVRVAGQFDPEQVWRTTRTEMNTFVRGDVLAANANLIRAVETKNLKEYLKVVDVRMLLAEQEAGDHDETADGADEAALQKSFVNLEVVNGGDVQPEETQTNSITNVQIQFHDGTSATVTYERVISLPDGEVLSKMQETRVWKYNETHGGWLNVHFVRQTFP